MLIDKLFEPDQPFSCYKCDRFEMTISFGILIKAPLYFKASTVQVLLIWKVLLVAACCKNSVVAKVANKPDFSCVQGLCGNTQVEYILCVLHAVVELNLLSINTELLLKFLHLLLVVVHKLLQDGLHHI
ncbi:hypothetical protein D3C81_1828930 [compost metagenome]